MKEIWKDIPDYECLYQASNFGRIRSLNRIDNCNKPRIGKILKFFKSKNGYFQVWLSKNGKAHIFLVHKLIAKTFLENPHNYLYINHIDGNKSNNNVLIIWSGVPKAIMLMKVIDLACKRNNMVKIIVTVRKLINMT